MIFVSLIENRPAAVAQNRCYLLLEVARLRTQKKIVMVQNVCQHHEYVQITYENTGGAMITNLQCKNCGRTYTEYVENKKIAKESIAIAFYRAFPHEHLHHEDYVLAVNLLEKIAEEKQKMYETKNAKI